jgi:predicted transcriptional regulator
MVIVIVDVLWYTFVDEIVDTQSGEMCMATTTIRVSTETRDLLHDLARRRGTSMQQVLEDVLKEYRRRQFLAALNAAYLAAQADPAMHAAEAAELAEWDGTLLDGLDEMEEWDES